jgi:hypothetical protein
LNRNWIPEPFLYPPGNQQQLREKLSVVRFAII